MIEWIFKEFFAFDNILSLRLKIHWCENGTYSTIAQEVDFFMGVRDVYQMFVVYPNVALSCVIDFKKIQKSLSEEEKTFFFRGIIDCVVFDQHNNYKPIKGLSRCWIDTSACWQYCNAISAWSQSVWCNCF